ncbi:MAG: c-type cytochrome [Planctomycetales bacterium]|nr:c-type cytochrome [Planctomycetales bacterium]
MKPSLQLGLFLIALGTCAHRVQGQGYSPREAAAKMTVAEGLRVRLFASEPEVRQPSFVKCDDRGRLWTIQYLQYPNPAGLERVQVDRWSRTVYDRIPQPPPHGPRGADKITILEDTDRDGKADQVKDFVDGLNLVTGVAFGHGGVFVLNAPYLLFYPDRDRNDVPDADPEVLLTGFGMEDAQSMSNHLTWGPDGWLYGVNGSTTTCRIRELEFQQGVWRYHPHTRQFELFCEGGSNCYGITFDQNGELYYSTNGGPFVHAVQGGYYFKSFGKHGPLHNLYAYHYFPNLTCDQVPGGPPTGGTIYLGHSFPQLYRGKFMAGNFLGHTASWWSVEPQGSTVQAKFGATIFDSNDTWFGPTDLCLGPDGSIYVCDFHDQRTAHPDPDANWDRENGRIYTIEAHDVRPQPEFDLARLSASELVDLLSHENFWFRDRARVELASRRDASVTARLRTMALQTADPQLALQGLWAFHLTTGLDDPLAIELLNHPFEYVRFWTVRLLGDQRHVSPPVARPLIELAGNESSPIVRAQLAATARRLPGSVGLAIAGQLLDAHPQEADERIPWLLWWAIEAKAMSDTATLATMFASDQAWQNPARLDNALRLVRRYAAEGDKAADQACLQLLTAAPAAQQLAAHQHLRLGLAERTAGLSEIGQGGLYQQQASPDEQTSTRNSRPFEPLAAELRAYVDQLWKQQPTDLLHLELALRAGNSQALQFLISRTTQLADDPERLTPALNLLGEFGDATTALVVLGLFENSTTDEVRFAALNALTRWESSDVTQSLLTHYPGATPELAARIRDVFFTRPRSALEFLKRVDAGDFNPQDVPLDQLRRLAVHRLESIDSLVLKHWGNIGSGSPEEKLATMRRYNNDLRAASGDPIQGKALFAKHCGICHQLHGEGHKIGPDLTTANRTDRAALLANVVDPSAVIRREYLNYVVETSSGRVLTGLLAEQDAASVTLLDEKNQRTKVPRDEIEDLHELETSLMPEKTLDVLTPQQLRDLFSYLEQ